MTEGNWVTCLISSKIPLCDWMLWTLFLSETKSLSSHIPGFLSEACSLTANLLILVSFAIWISWKYPKSPSPVFWFFFLLHFFLQFISAPPHFTISSKKKSGHSFHTLLGKLLNYVSKFIDYSFCFPNNWGHNSAKFFGHDIIRIPFPPVFSNLFLITFWIITISTFNIYISDII